MSRCKAPRRLNLNERNLAAGKFVLTVFTVLYVSAFEEYCKHPSAVLKQMPLTEGVYLRKMKSTFKLRPSHVRDLF